MEMTIDEVIKALKWFMEYNEEDYYVGDRFQDEYGDWFYKVSERDFKAFRQAVDIMCKYQKIANLYDYWRSGKCEYTISCMENIGKVLKDGENNN